ncbi:hypothetical protein F5H01DRAFT_325567 [Linnemannia elongata]|nr:hypothetical protein F5H01DRAFT_325567 [Linnemannia elongata]
MCSLVPTLALVFVYSLVRTLLLLSLFIPLFAPSCSAPITPVQLKTFAKDLSHAIFELNISRSLTKPFHSARLRTLRSIACSSKAQIPIIRMNVSSRTKFKYYYNNASLVRQVPSTYALASGAGDI